MTPGTSTASERATDNLRAASHRTPSPLRSGLELRRWATLRLPHLLRMVGRSWSASRSKWSRVWTCKWSSPSSRKGWSRSWMRPSPASGSGAWRPRRRLLYAAGCATRDRCLHLDASAGLSTNLNGKYRRSSLARSRSGELPRAMGAPRPGSPLLIRKPGWSLLSDAYFHSAVLRTACISTVRR